MPSDSFVAQSYQSVKPVDLPAHVIARISEKYERGAGRASVAKLSQGEIDILDDCRQALGWRYLTSLAHKYYPLYPERHCWKRALAICMRYRESWYTKSLNIFYLLKAVAQQVSESLERNFSGSLDAIRIVSKDTNTEGKDYSNSTIKSRFLKFKPGGYQEYVLRRQGLIA